MERLPLFLWITVNFEAVVVAVLAYVNLQVPNQRMINWLIPFVPFRLMNHSSIRLLNCRMCAFGHWTPFAWSIFVVAHIKSLVHFCCVRFREAASRVSIGNKSNVVIIAKSFFFFSTLLSIKCPTRPLGQVRRKARFFYLKVMFRNFTAPIWRFLFIFFFS